MKVSKKNKDARTPSYKHAALMQGFACSSPVDAKKILRTSSHGLSEKEAELRLELSGKNEIASERNDWRKQLTRAIHNRFNLLVTTLALVSYFTHDIEGAIVMASMVVLAVTLTFFQEYRSSKAAEKLKAMVDTKVTVTRRNNHPDHGSSEDDSGTKREIALSDVVPGDLVHLCAGDIIPGDLKLFSAKDLFVNQATLTGESLPVEKSASADSPDENHLCPVRARVTETGRKIKIGPPAPAWFPDPKSFFSSSPSFVEHFLDV